MRLLHRSGICALALVAGSAALQLEPAILRDLVFSAGNQRITVEAVKAPLWSAALAQSAESFTLENVRFTFGTATYEASRIEFSGVTASRADVEALFSPASGETLAARLERIGAKQVTIPEITATQKLGSQTQKVVYRNVTLSDVVQGRIASAIIEATAIEETGADDAPRLSYGRATISDVDVPALARLYETKAETDSAPLTRMYGDFSIENIEVVAENRDARFTVARVNGRDFMARPTRDSWAGTMALYMDIAGKDDLPSEEQARVARATADFLSAFDIAFVEATGIEMKAMQEGESAEDDASRISGHIDRIAYTGRTASQPSDIRLEGLRLSDEEGRMTLAAISLTGFSLAPTLEGLSALQAQKLEDLDQDDLRKLIPTLGTLRLSGLDADVPNAEDDGKRVQLTLKEFELTAEKPVNAVPTHVRLGVQNLAMALPQDSEDDGIKELVALGYETIDLSFLAAADWNEQTNEIALQEISLKGKDMGALSIKGLIGNAGKDIFSSDQATALAALIGAKVKSATVTVEEEGLLDRYLAQAAKEQKTTPEELRTLYAGAAPLLMSSMIGNSQQAKTLSQAIARFISDRGRLTVHATPKNSSGFGVMDAMLTSDPKEILEKLDIAAEVE